MLCENCKSKNASVHYSHTVNGKKTEAHLCSECAEKLIHSESKYGFEDSLFSGMFGGLFGKSIFSPASSQGGAGASIGYKERICPSCGMSESELHRGGKLGCRQCYETFSDTVNAMLGKLHVSTEYKGKIPETVSENLSLERKAEKLRKEMHDAVERQDYEEAARIRDAIRQLMSSDTDKTSDGGGTDEVV